MCHEKGWEEIERWEKCRALGEQRENDFWPWYNNNPTTTKKPFFQTTTTAEQKLYQAVITYQTTTEAVPHPTAAEEISSGFTMGTAATTAKPQDFTHTTSTEDPGPDYSAIAWAMTELYYTGKETYDLMCAEVNRMPSQKVTTEEFNALWDPLWEALPVCNANLWYAELKEVLLPIMDRQHTIYMMHHFRKLTLGDEVIVQPEVTAMCADYANNEGKHLQDFLDELHQAGLDQSYRTNVEAPKVPTYHEGQNSRHLEEAHWNSEQQYIYVHFGNMDAAQTEAYCGVAKTYTNKELTEDWWAVKKRHFFHKDSLSFWTTRMGRVQNWGLQALMAVESSPRDLLKSFVTNPKDAVAECKKALDVVKAEINDIWDDDRMQSWKEHQMKTRYLMKKCHSMYSRGRDLDGHGAHAKASATNIWATKNEICDNIDSWQSEHTVTIGAGGDIELDDFLAAVIQCGDKVQTWLGAKYNQKIDYPDESYCEDHIFSRLKNHETVMLKKWAYWEFNEMDRHFVCFEKHFIEAQKKYIDTTVHTCALMSNMDHSVYAGMSAALEKDHVADMHDVAHHVIDLYTAEYSSTESRWSTVTRIDGELAVEEIPGLEVDFTAIADASDEDILKAIQEAAEVGIATELVGTTARFFDVSEADALAKMESLSNLASNGFTFNGNQITVTSVAFPPHYEQAHAAYKTAHGSDAAYVEYVCAINPNADDGQQLRQGHSATQAEPAASSGGNPPATVESVPPASAGSDSAPASNTGDAGPMKDDITHAGNNHSSASGISVMALSGAALMLM
jgi:hypothetical protein